MVKCCLCGKDAGRYGNSPYPLLKEGRCCDECNFQKVIPARLHRYKSIQASDKLEELDIGRGVVRETMKASDCQAKIKGLDLDDELKGGKENDERTN